MSEVGDVDACYSWQRQCMLNLLTHEQKDSSDGFSALAIRSMTGAAVHGYPGT